MYIKFVFIVTFFTHSADYIAAQSFEEYVCKFCNQHATTGEANARFGRGLNESALHEIVMKELQRVMSNESAFRQAVRKEVDAVLDERCIQPQCIHGKRALRDDEMKPAKFGRRKWKVFQRRISSNLDFFRDWNDYVNGFGDSGKDFWLGLEALHQMTKDGDHEMRVDMFHENGTYLYAAYRYFMVGPASGNYRLGIGGYSGTATDSMAYHNNRPFSTKDADNDATHTDCARLHNKGGWWYHNCAYSNLNGVFRATGWGGVAWFDHNSNRWMNLRVTEMRVKIRD